MKELTIDACAHDPQGLDDELRAGLPEGKYHGGVFRGQNREFTLLVDDDIDEAEVKSIIGIHDAVAAKEARDAKKAKPIDKLNDQELSDRIDGMSGEEIRDLLKSLVKSALKK